MKNSEPKCLTKQQPVKGQDDLSSKIRFINVSNSMIILYVSIQVIICGQVTGYVDRDGYRRLGGVFQCGKSGKKKSDVMVSGDRFFDECWARKWNIYRFYHHRSKYSKCCHEGARWWCSYDRAQIRLLLSSWILWRGPIRAMRVIRRLTLIDLVMSKKSFLYPSRSWRRTYTLLGKVLFVGIADWIGKKVLKPSHHGQ